MTYHLASDTITVDVLVVGGGMGGMTTAVQAVQRGASVAVAEVADRIGGSAAMSAGIVWTARDVETFRAEDPAGDERRYRIVRSELEAAIDWIRELDVPLARPFGRLSDVRVGAEIDVSTFFARARTVVEHAGTGWVVVGAEPLRLLTSGHRVHGAELLDRGDIVRIHAGATVLATGGFQCDPDLRERYLFDGARSMLVRSNPHSAGTGLRLATSAGAARTAPMHGYYGHLMPSPLDEVRPEDFRHLAQKHSSRGVLVNRDGRRFTDESAGDHKANMAIGPFGTAVLVIDERVRRQHMMEPTSGGYDRMSEAGHRGARYARADSLDGVADIVSGWGYAGDPARRTIEAFNAGMAGGIDAAVPRRRYRDPLDEPPFSLLEVQPGITFTFGGIVTDDDGRVLDAEGRVIDGLFAAGVDSGGLNVSGYTGGLSRSLVLGRRTGRAVADVVVGTS